MRRLMPIAAFALLLTVPLWAQRGGGHGGGGGHAGFGGGHAGFSGGHAGFSGGHVGGFGAHSFSGHSGFSGGRFSGGVHSGYSRSFNHNFSRANRAPFLHDSNRFSHDGNRFRNGFNNGFNFRLRTGNFGFRNRWGRGWGYPWWGWGYYDPWLWDWWNSNSDYNDDYNQDAATAAEMNRQNLEEQEMRRQEEADRDRDANDNDRDAYVRPPMRPRPSASDDRQAELVLPATLLIFRDQHKEEVHNYAIVGQTLWNFSPQHTEKIPLSDLDLTATTKANEERGVTFHIPVPGAAPTAPPTNMQGQPSTPSTNSSSTV